MKNRIFPGHIPHSLVFTLAALVFNVVPAQASFTVYAYSIDGQHYAHTATKLENGMVLVTGGCDNEGNATGDVYLFNPVSNGGYGGWTTKTSMQDARMFHTATLLKSGKVLVVGGESNDGGYGCVPSYEVYDPGEDSWSPHSMPTYLSTTYFTSPYKHTATLLADGKVLIAGGITRHGGATTNDLGATTFTFLFDPSDESMSMSADIHCMSQRRSGHTATLLRNGKVLLVGGIDDGDPLATYSLYDPSNESWVDDSMPRGRLHHQTTMLGDGTVLVTGGYDDSWNYSTASDIYDPVNGWSDTASDRIDACIDGTLTLLPNGKALSTGGDNENEPNTTSRLFDPVSLTWSETCSFAHSRSLHTATLLDNGTVLVQGGITEEAVADELYIPAWTATSGSMTTARSKHSATLLGNGQVLIAGGNNHETANIDDGILASAELYNPVTDTWSSGGTMGYAGDSNPVTREEHTATLMPNGKVLVFGGIGHGYFSYSPHYYDSYQYTAALYTPGSGWSSAASLAEAQGRCRQATVLLGSGKVLVVGGFGSSIGSDVELYGTSDSWAQKASLPSSRYYHSATLLPDGKVLVAGGYDGGSRYGSYIYDPTGNSWAATTHSGSTTHLAYTRKQHMATLLLNGKVLVTGGVGGNATDQTGSSICSSTELYDPSTQTWSDGGTMQSTRSIHTATLLPNGMVLVTGGDDNTAELYNPDTKRWTYTVPMANSRQYHTATLLGNGRVLVVGGDNGSGTYRGAEFLDW